MSSARVSPDQQDQSYSCVTRSNIPEWNSGSEPIERQLEIRDWLQNVGLQMGEDYLIDPAVTSIRMGLGWDRGPAIDASAVTFDERLAVMDSIWYRNLRSSDGSVSHSGDNRTGVGEGDDKVISVALSDVPLNVHFILFTVSVYSYDTSFADVQSAYVRMMHGKKKHNHREMCRFSLTQMSGHAMLVGVLARKGAYWDFRALGTPATGRTVEKLLQSPETLQCLSEIPSFSPELRRVAVSVVQGTNLAAKDSAGLFRRQASSDPYFVIKFKGRKFKSEYKSQTLEPEWKSAAPFEMGCITESEMKALKIELFDYDVIGADDFMGMVRIPGYALFSLGSGHHMYWFTLESSKKKKYREEEVSGKILVEISVESADAN